MRSDAFRKCEKGQNAYYHYYHCNAKCGFCYKVDKVSQLFVEEILIFFPDGAILELQKEIIMQEYTNQTKNRRDEKRMILAEIEKQKKLMNMLENSKWPMKLNRPITVK